MIIIIVIFKIRNVNLNYVVCLIIIRMNVKIVKNNYKNVKNYNNVKNAKNNFKQRLRFIGYNF